jgi:D-alanine-D-alanine ligase-like ATP-grasp enzyme
MILGATISELPPGKFRENILKDALKANSRINVNPGVLSYLGRENTLILHTKLFIQGTSVDEIIKEMKHLTSRAKKWMDAIDEGRASPDEEIPKKVGLSGKGMFGF